MARGASSGISFDEYMRKKYEEEEEKRTTGKSSFSSSKTATKKKIGEGASSGISFDEYMADKYDSSYSIDAEGVDNWFKNAANFSSTFKQSDTSMYTTDYGAEYKSTLKSLMDQSQEVRRYLRANKSNIKDYDGLYDSYAQFNQYLRSVNSHINGVNKYFGQFDNEEHYQAQKAYEGSLGELYMRVKQGEDSDEGRIAYTTKDGQNVTWKDLYELKKAEVEYDTLSAKPDWDEKSAGLGIGSLSFGDGSLSDEDIIFEISRTLMPHDLEYAIEDGYTEEQFNDIQAKREYISKKYGADVLNDIYGDTEKLATIGNMPWYMEDMTDEEKAVLSYIYNTQGWDAANEWLTPKMDAITQRKYHRIGLELEQESPVWANVLSVPINFASGIEYVADGVNYLVTGNEQTNALATMGSTIRGATSERIDSDFGKWLYNTGMSGVDSLTATLVPGGTFLLAGSAAAQGYNDAVARGMSTGDALFTGFRNGVNEYLFERISLGQFKGLKEGLVNGPKAFAKNLAKTMFVNATEEELTEIANIVSDRVFNADFSQVATSYRQYLANGINPEEAKELVKQDINAQIFEAGASGALMGFGFGTIGNVAAHSNFNQAAQQWGEKIIGNSGVEDLKALANEVAGVSNKNRITKLANKTSAKSSRRNAKNVGKLSYEVDSARMEQNRADITKALVEKGVSKIKAKSYADALVEMNEEFYRGASPFTLGTDKQWKKITGDENAYSILRKVVTDENSSVNIRNLNHNLARMGLKQTEGGAITFTEQKGKAVETAVKKAMAEESYAESAKDVANVKPTIAEDGKTKDVSTGNEIAIKGIDHIEVEKDNDGNVTDRIGYFNVVDSEGNESVVSARDVEYGNKSEGLIYESFVAMGVDPAYFDTYVNGYNANDFKTADGKVADDAVTQYALGFQNAYRYGWVGIEGELDASTFASKLNPTARKAAYDAGVNARQYDVDTKQGALDTAVEERKASGKGKARTQGKLHMEGVKTTKGLTAMQNAGVGLAKRLLSLGADVYIYESHRDANGNWVDDRGEPADNGFYRLSDGSIHIDLNAGQYGQGIMVYTLSHELVHWMRPNAEREFKIFADLLIKWYGKKGVSVSEQISEIMHEDGLDWDGAYEELVARSCESFLTDSNIAERIMELQQTDKRTWEIVRDKVLDFLNWMKSLFANIDPESAEGQFVRQYKSEIDHLYNAFYNALASASETLQWTGAEDENANAASSKSTADENAEDVKESTRSKKNLALRPKSTYNSFSTEAMQWSHRTYRQNGDSTVIYDGRRRKYILIEATDDGYIEVFAGNYEKVRSIYEQAHRGADYEIHEDSNEARTQQGRGLWDMQLSQNRGNDDRNAGQAGSEGLQTDAAGDDEHLRRGNQGEYVKKSTRKSAPTTYTEAQYNAFGWASYNDVITAQERETLLSRFADFKHNKDKYPVTRWGEAVIHSTEAPGVIVYVKTTSTIKLPEITRIVRIVVADADLVDIEAIQEEVVFNEQEQVLQPYESTELIYGEEVFRTHKKRDSISFQEYLSREKGGDSETSVSDSKGFQDGRSSRGSGIKGGRADGVGEVKKSFRRDYSFNALTSKPDMVVTTLDGTVPRNRADVIAAAKKNAAEVGKANKDGSVSVYVDDVGRDVVLPTSGLRHGLDRRFNINAPVTVKAGEILQHSICINELTPTKEAASASYILVGAGANEDGEVYVVRSVVNRFTSELTEMDVLYAINAKTEPVGEKKRNQAGADPQGLRSNDRFLTGSTESAAFPPKVTTKVATPTDSTISIAELLDYVNRYFPDILPEDVLKHYGHTERPDGDLGESVLYSRRGSETSNRSLLANALDGTVQNDSEARRLAEYKEKIDLINAEEKKLRETREQIAELSFAKGPKDTLTLKNLHAVATRIANRINTYDKQLLNLEATAPLKAVLERERTMARKREKQKAAESVAKQREKDAKTLREVMNRNAEARKRNIDSRHKTEMRHKIKSVVSELNQLLLHGTRDKHIKIDLQKATAEALSAINMDTVNAEKRLEEIQRKINATSDPDKIARLQETYDRIEQQGENMMNKLTALKNAYDEIKDSSDPLVANAYHPEIEERIKNLRKEVGDTPLREMSLVQLENVYDTYRMVLHTIRTANKAFKAKKAESIAALANRTMEEVHTVGGTKAYSSMVTDVFKKFYWNGLKPVYAFKAIGSGTLSDIFDSVRAGEDTWAVDVSEAKEYYNDVSKKYNYDSWDFDKQYKFTSKTGREFSLSIEQIMSLYAYSKRKQADEHLEKGGFVFDEAIEVTQKKHGIPVKYRVNVATSHTLSKVTLGEIVSTLSDEQRTFVDEMQAYLSDVMGAKGNEVSLEMFGVKLFKEKSYFPLKSAKQFMYEQNEVAGEVRLKNSGFSKETVAHANNPIILSNFMDVWANHVNDMSMYHSFVLPLEDFNRVFNYKTPTTESMDTESVKMYIQNAYGSQPIQYIKQLLTDLNGGARTDPSADFITRMTGLFKKSAVFASASVVIQQPSAIARAAALIDNKYFATKLSVTQHKAEWAEVKKYAPVAIIKEMGYFDTHMGRSTTDFIKAKDYDGVAEKMKGLVTDSGYRDEVLSKAPAMADELAWCYIWNAVKKEVADTTDIEVGSEEFLQKCGERFTEVVVNTQVYDSVLSRSAMMRSKDTGMKMATAFMAEPTTSINMIADALIQGKRGNKKGASKQIGAVIASMILNSILVSFVYAGRDDDEDKTYAEKYIGTITTELLDSINPLTMIPFVKDIVSIAQGYDVERSDMAVISDLFTAFEKLSNDNLSTYRKVEDFGGAIASIFGLPVKNIMRDVRAMYNTVSSFIDEQDTTGEGVWQAIKEGIPSEAETNAEQLYDAIISGDEAHAERVKSRYKDDDAIESAMRSQIKEHYLDSDIDSTTAMQYLVNYCDMESDDAYWRIREWDNADDEDYNKYDDFISAVKSGTSVGVVIKQYTDNGVEMDSLKSTLGNAYKDGELNESSVRNALLSHFGMDEDDVYWQFDRWDYAKKNGSSEGYSKYADFFTAVETGKNLKNTIKRYTDNGVEAKTLASQITQHFKPLYIEMSNAERANIMGYLLNAYVMLGYKRADKNKDINNWLKD